MKTLLVLLLVVAADADTKTRKPSAIAPSLPALTKEEEQKIEDVIDRFIQADTGRLRGAEARKALQDFDALKAEAIPALIRGLNRAAKDNQTCPVLTITKKLSKLLMASDDQKLLEYARDEIGADGAERSRYGGALKDLRFKILMRKNTLARTTTTPKTAEPKTLAKLSIGDLVKSASTERGEKLKGVIAELAKRDGKEALEGLTVATSTSDADVKRLARAAMDAHLGRLTANALSPYLEDDSAEVRKSAVRVAAAKHLRLITKVIDRVDDDNAEVRDEARAALKKLSKGQDFGPQPAASADERREAKKKWQAWWETVRK